MKPSQYISKGWCQGNIARGTEGHICSPEAPEARQWCLYGAVYIAYYNDVKKRETIVSRLVDILHSGLAYWNDKPTRTQAEVITLLTSIGE